MPPAPTVPPFRKVALVSHWGTAYVRRLMMGALSYTETAGNIVTRDFRLPDEGENDGGNWQTELNRLHNWKPDGLLCALEVGPLRRLIESFPQAPPVVSFYTSTPISGVVLVAGRLATMFEIGIKHLRQEGFRSFAYLDMDDLSHFNAREMFTRIARPKDPAAACLIEVINPSRIEELDGPVAPVPERLAAWLHQLPKPVGILCSTNGGGGYLIRVCQELGYRVPEDVAVVGVDEVDLALASTPPLTTVLPARQQIGHTAMRVLDEILCGKPAPTEPVRLEAMDLYVRGSTGMKRGEICNIAAALDYINRHACQGISVDQVIRETQHVSKATFYTRFQAATGQSPGDVIQQRQVAEAKRLLADTQISITTIAESCGFSDSSSFARGFRALQGVSPRDFRKQAKAHAGNA